MGSSILLVPLDVFRLSEGLGASFEELLERCLELHVVDGVILPNLKMDGEKKLLCVPERPGALLHSQLPSGDLPDLSSGKIL